MAKKTTKKTTTKKTTAKKSAAKKTKCKSKAKSKKKPSGCSMTGECFSSASPCSSGLSKVKGLLGKVFCCKKNCH